MLSHSFSVDLAKKYGVERALILSEFVGIIADNDPEYFVELSPFMAHKLFPYWSDKKIRLLLRKMCADGILTKRATNKNKMDRTLSYRLSSDFRG